MRTINGYRLYIGGLDTYYRRLPLGGGDSYWLGIAFRLDDNFPLYVLTDIVVVTRLPNAAITTELPDYVAILFARIAMAISLSLELRGETDPTTLPLPTLTSKVGHA
jgi:hypothetical protein